MNTPITRLEVHLMATMTAMQMEDPDGVLRIQRVYHSFMGTIARTPITEITVEPEDMVEMLEENVRGAPDDEFGLPDYTRPSPRARLRLA